MNSFTWEGVRSGGCDDVRSGGCDDVGSGVIRGCDNVELRV